MHFKGYQDAAMSYRKDTADNVYALLMLGEEVGEVLGKVAKWRRDKTPLDVLKDDIKKELGDVLWGVAAVAADFDLHLDDVAQANLDKLASRKQRGVIGGAGDAR